MISRFLLDPPALYKSSSSSSNSLSNLLLSYFTWMRMVGVFEIWPDTSSFKAKIAAQIEKLRRKTKGHEGKRNNRGKPRPPRLMVVDARSCSQVFRFSLQLFNFLAFLCIKACYSQPWGSPFHSTTILIHIE